MADYTLVLSAGQQLEIGAVGRYYRVIEAAADLYIGIDGRTPQMRPQGVGEEVPEGFRRLSVRSATAQTVLLTVSDGRVDDSRLSLSAPVAVARGASVNHSKHTVGTSAVTVAGVDSTRRAIWFTNAGSTTLYLGKGGVTTAVGFQLLPGSTLAFDQAAGALWQCISSSAGGDLRVIEELD